MENGRAWITGLAAAKMRQVGGGEQDYQLSFHLPLVSDTDVCVATIRLLLIGIYIGQTSYKMFCISLSIKQKNH